MTDDLHIQLSVLKSEAERIMREAPDTPINAAYGLALANIATMQAEQQAVSPFEARLLGAMDQIQREHGGGRPVSTLRLAVELGIDNRFTVLYYLRGLERRGLIYRPMGPHSKSGWAVAA